jgi:CRP-like cAMP-binding protein
LSLPKNLIPDKKDKVPASKFCLWLFSPLNSQFFSCPMKTKEPPPVLSPEFQGASHQRCCRAGDVIYRQGEPGRSWRVLSGIVRLDRESTPTESGFVSLAIKGDVIGAEILLFNQYTFTATALADCELLAWPEGEEAPLADSILRVMATAERRTSEMLVLRCGQATARLKNLLQLLSRGCQQDESSNSKRVTLPSVRDIAQITALTMETVSRTISIFKKSGTISSEIKQYGVQPLRVVSFLADR